MKTIKLNDAQKKAAKNLNLGSVVFSYLDGKAIRIELENADDPYVWRNNSWRAMK